MGSPEAAAQVRAAEDRRYAAMLAADTGVLAGLLAAELAYTHSSGSCDTRESLLAEIGSGALIYLAVEHPVTQLIVLGDVVLVVGEMHADIVSDGAPRRLDNATLAVWAAQDGDWRLVAFQPTPLPR
jgi:ketosteroid isomerase-like protein